MENNAKGSGFLKVTGILLIIGGAIAIIVSIIAVLGMSAIEYMNDGSISTGLLWFACILALISAVAELVAGIIGVKNCKKPEKAGTCIAWGVIVAVLSVAGSILTVAAGGEFSFVSLLLGLVLPVLFIVGAVLNKKAA